jgi:hypothetical protein
MSDSLERAREHRASLRAAIGGVESALAAPAPRREASWRKELGVSLSALGDALDSHITTSEAADGLLADIISAAPRLAHRVERARTDHQQLRAEVQLAMSAVDEQTGVAVLRDQVVDLLTNLVRHRQLGSDLVYDAYNVDIEAGD